MSSAKSDVKSTARSSAFSTLRSVVFTDNNPVSFQPDWPDYVRYAVWQLEVGKSGTKHLQGYLEFKHPVHFTSLKKLLPRAHFEKRFGTRDQARDYCMKADTRLEGPWEFGIWKDSSASSRNGFHAVLDAIQSGASSEEIMNRYPGIWFRFRRSVDVAIAKHNDRPRTHRTRLHVICGDPGSGKTRYVMNHVPDAHWQSLKAWLDGYDGVKPLVIDEMDKHGTAPDLGFILRLCDRTPMRLAVKCSSVEMQATDVFLIGNLKPEYWFKNIPDQFLEAFLRRIDSQLELKYQDSQTILHLYHEFFVDEKPKLSVAQSAPASESTFVDPRKVKSIQARIVSADADLSNFPPYKLLASFLNESQTMHPDLSKKYLPLS